MTDITLPIPVARPRTLIGTLLGWATNIALLVVLVLIVIALVRSPPSALH